MGPEFPQTPSQPEVKKTPDVPRNGLNLPLWNDVLEIAKDAELTPEERINKITELKFQSLIGHKPVTVSLNKPRRLQSEDSQHNEDWLAEALSEGLLSGGFSQDIMGRDTYRFPSGKSSQEYKQTIFALATGKATGIRTGEPGEFSILRSPIFRRLILDRESTPDEQARLERHTDKLITFESGFPAVILNIDDIPKAERERRSVEYTDSFDMPREDEYKIGRSRLGPEYFRGVIIPHSLTQDMWRSSAKDGSRPYEGKYRQFVQSVEACLALQERIFKDRFELYLPIIAVSDYRGGGREVICFPPPEGFDDFHDYLQKAWETPLLAEK